MFWELEPSCPLNQKVITGLVTVPVAKVLNVKFEPVAPVSW